MSGTETVNGLAPDRYRDFFNNTQDMLVVTDADGVVIDTNRALLDDLGYSMQELDGFSVWEFAHPKADVKANKQFWRTLVNKGRIDGFETIWQRQDDGAVRVSVDATARYKDDGSFMCAYIIVRDITERKRLEVELRESDGRYRRIVETANEGIWTIDAENITTFVNARMAEMMGYRVDEMVGKPLFSFLDRKGQDTVEKKLERRRKGVREQYELQLRRKDGTPLWALLETSPLTDREGRFIGALAMMTDISARKQAEDELRESEERFRQLAENIREVFWMMTLDFSETLYVSAGYEEIWGRSRESLYESPMDWIEAVHEDDRERVEAAAQDLASLDVEYRIVRPDGEVRWIHDRGFPVKDESGEVYRAAGVAEDITEQKRVENELREREQAYRALFSRCPDGIVVADIENKEFKYVNERACQMFGYEEEDMCKIGVADIHRSEDLPRVLAEFEALASGEKVVAESIPCVRNDGTVFFTDISSAPVTVDGRECMIGFLRDITERKLAEEAQKETELRLSHIEESTHEFFWMTSPDVQKVYYVSPAFEKIFGRSPERFVEDPNLWVEAVHPGDRDRITTAMQEGATSGDYDEEFRIVRPDNSIRWVRTRIMPLKDESGEIYRIAGITEDINERKLAENEIKEARDYLEERVEERTSELSKTVTRLKQEIEERHKAEHEVEEQAQTLQALFEESFDGIVVADAETREIEYVNRASSQMFGYEKDEMQEMGIADLHPKEDLPRVFAEFQAQVNCEKALAESVPCQRKNTNVFHADINSTIAIIRSRRCFVGFYRDITDRE